MVKQVLQCAMVAIALLLILAIRFGFESRHLSNAERAIHVELAQLFNELFPTSPENAGSGLRIQSERIRLEGLTNKSNSSIDVPEARGMVTFSLLHNLTQHLPGSARVNIEEMLLDRNGIRLSGLTTSHSVAGEWVRQLNTNSNVTADPPRTKLRPDGTVEFRVHVRQTENDLSP
jgi:hypothetical protein